MTDWDRFFELECMVVDFLPRQVPEGAPGMFFAVEEEYLSRCGAQLRERFLNVLLKLCCYYDLKLYVPEEDLETVSPAPEELRERVLSGRYGLDLLFGGSVLVTAGAGDTHMTVYGAGEEFLGLLRPIAASEGLFVWQPPRD